MELRDVPDRIDAALAPVLGFLDAMAARLGRFSVLSVGGAVAFALALTGGWILDGGIRTLAALVVLAVALLPAAALTLYRRRLAAASDDVRTLSLALRGWAEDDGRAERLEQLLAPAAEVRNATSRAGKARAAVGLFHHIRRSVGDVAGLSSVAQRLATTFGALGGITLAAGFGGTALVAAGAACFGAIRLLVLVL